MRALVLFCLLVSGVLLSTASGQGAAGTRARQVEAGLPIVFEPVTDRQGGAAGLVGRAEGLSLGFAPAAVDFAPGGRTSDRFRITFSGARPVTPVGDALQRSQTNYLVGSDPAQWRTHVPNFARVRYAGLYPGVDAVFYGNGRAMEHDFVVAPGADAAQIRMHFSDGARVSIDGEGALRIELKGGMLQMKRPVLYQEEDGRRQNREGQFRVLPDGDVGFAIASYDHRRELVIDPVLSFATYLSSVAVDGSLLAIDASGNNYVTGATGVGFPVTTGAFAGCGGCGASATVMFLSKLSADGKSLVYSTVLGGNAAAQPTGIVVDASGDALVAGITAATDFPTKNGQPVTALGGNDLGFLVSLSPDGSSLNYGTMLGSSPASGLSNATYAQAVAVDDSGNAFVTGETGAGFATTPGALNQGGGTSSGDSFNVYVAKFSATGGLVYSAVLGAADPQNGADGPIGASAIAVDAAGDAFVAGQAGTLWPITSNAYQSQIAGPMPSAAPFVTKVAPDGSSLLYSTYLDYAYVVAGIAVLPNGNVFVAGSGAGSTYPTTPGAYQANSGGGSFVSELNATGSALVFSTIVGDPYYTLNAFALDVGGDLWLAGTTTNASFALVNPLQGTFPIEPLGVTNASTLSELDPTGHTLKFSTFLGGVASGSANSVAIDASLRAHVGGTAEYGLYTTPGAYLGSVPMLAPAYEGETFAYVNVVDPTVPAPGLCAIPNNGLNFLGTAIGSSPQEVVSLTNCGTQPLTISSVTAGRIDVYGACVGDAVRPDACGWAELRAACPIHPHRDAGGRVDSDYHIECSRDAGCNPALRNWCE